MRRKRTGFCEKHPYYQAERRPTSGCVACQKAYDRRFARPDSLSKYLKRRVRQYEKPVVELAESYAVQLARVTGTPVEIHLTNHQDTSGFAVRAAGDGNSVKTERWINMDHAKKLGLS